MGVRGNDKSAVERFTKEIAPLILTGPPAVTTKSNSRSILSRTSSIAARIKVPSNGIAMVRAR